MIFQELYYQLSRCHSERSRGISRNLLWAQQFPRVRYEVAAI